MTSYPSETQGQVARINRSFGLRRTGMWTVAAVAPWALLVVDLSSTGPPSSLSRPGWYLAAFASVYCAFAAARWIAVLANSATGGLRIANGHLVGVFKGKKRLALFADLSIQTALSSPFGSKKFLDVCFSDGSIWHYSTKMFVEAPPEIADRIKLAALQERE